MSRPRLLPLRDLFAAPTIARLAARIGALQAGSAPGLAAPPLEAAAEPGPAELSFSQQRLWFLDQMEPGKATYVIAGALEMRGALEADQQAAERGFDVGICRMHHINNNAGVATVTVVEMRAGAVTH